MTDTQNTHSSQTESNILTTLATDYLKERRRKRRWGIFFKVVFAAWFIWLIYVFSDQFTSTEIGDDHVAMIDIQGPILEKEQANADNITKSLRQAFENKRVVGIILRINSPGGSAVQSDYVFNEILRLRKLNPNTKVYAVCSDICASGAYYIAAASDKIYSNYNSIIGSIGALYSGFGFVDLLEKLGVERRLITSGKDKGFLDPFLPLQEKQKAAIQRILDSTHQHFIQSVVKGRGSRIKQNPELFSGLVWSAKQAKEFGLIDDYGSAGSVARDVLENERIIDYTVKINYLEKFSKRFNATFTDIFMREKLHGVSY